MSPILPCTRAVPLPGQCDPVLNTIDCLVIVGEEAMNAAQLAMCIHSPFYRARGILCCIQLTA